MITRCLDCGEELTVAKLNEEKFYYALCKTCYQSECLVCSKFFDEEREIKIVKNESLFVYRR